MQLSIPSDHPARTRTRLIVLVCHFSAALACITLGQALDGNPVSPIWAPSGIAAAVVLRYGYAMLLPVAVANLLATLAGGNSLIFSLLGTLGACVEAGGARLLLQRHAGDSGSPSRLEDFLRFGRYAVLTAPLLGALCGGLALLLGTNLPWQDLPAAMGTWWLGNALGVLVVGTWLLALLGEKNPRRHLKHPARLALLFGGVLGVGLLLFSGVLHPHTAHRLGFLLLPFAVWSALGFGALVQCSVVLLLTLMAAGGTLLGLGTFVHGESRLTDMLTMSAFVAVTACTALLLGAMLADRRRLEKSLRRSHQQLNLLTRFFPDGGVAILEQDLRISLAGGQVLGLYGLDGEQLKGRSLTEVLPPELRAQLINGILRALQGEAAAQQLVYKERFYDLRLQPLPPESEEETQDGGGASCLIICHDVTDRVHAEQALADSYVFLQRTLDALPHPVFIKNKQGQYHLVNKAFCEMAGRPANELLGKTAYDLAPNEQAQTYHAKDMDLLAQGSGTQHYCYVAPWADGSLRQVYFSKALVQDPLSEETNIVGVVLDISDLHKAQEKLRASEARYRALFEEMNVAALVADLESGVILDANRQACRLLQRGKEELVGLHQTALHPPGENARYRDAFLNHARLRGDLEDGLELLAADGTRIPVEAATTVLEYEGRPALLGLFQDISERRNLERLRQDVENMTRHDLKTPLNGIIGLPHLLLDSPNLTPQQRELIQLIQDAGKRILTLVNLSLALYKMETATYRLQPEAVNLPPLLAEIRRDLEDLRRSRKLEIVEQWGDQGPAPDTFYVQGEELLCYSLFANLLKNALEAAPRNSEVSVRLDRNGTARVAIHNQGAVPEAIRSTACPIATCRAC